MRSAWVFLFLLSCAPETRRVADDEIDQFIRAEIARRRIPGLCLGIVDRGELVSCRAYGTADLEHDVPVVPDTVFELASITKTFTAAAILLLVAEKKVGLEDPIERHLQGSPAAWRGITVRHLLSHTSGLKDRFEPMVDGTWFLDYSTENLFRSAAKLPLEFAPGERGQYSDQGYFLLGMIVEKASGRRYGEFLADRIFKPLGMKNTTLRDQWAILKNRAGGYTLREGAIANNRRSAQIELVSHYGIMSTVPDLARYERALDRGELLSNETLQQMWTPVRRNTGETADILGRPYGLGWFLGTHQGRRTVEHGGVTGTHFLRLPEERVAVIVLTNLDWSAGSVPNTLTRGVADLYLANRRLTRP